MYCINCGVELADSEKKCPLCGTEVYHPDIKREVVSGPFPKIEPVHEEFNRQGVLFILSFLFAIPGLLTLICNLSLSHAITWSGYTAGAIALGYIIIVLPLWFKAPNPAIFVPIDFAAAALFLMYINYRVDGDWFLTFVLPVVSAAGVITTSVVALIRYLKQGYLYIFGGAFITSGASMMVIEVLMNYTFGLRDYFIWSFYPMIVFVLLGIMLLIIAICTPIRESLKKKFFI